MMMMDQRLDREVIFLSGVDPTTINESDIRDFFKQVTRSDVLVRFHYYSVVSKPRCTVEVTLSANDAMNALQKLNGYRLKNCTIKLTPRNSMKALILNNIPAIICEKDLFAMLARHTPGLKRIIMADDPEICGKTLGLAVASYENFEAARSALDRLKTFKLLERQIIATWKDPNYDVIGELALDTRVIYIKNISGQTTIDRIREILSAFGNVLTIKKLADRAFVEFDDMKSARRAMEHCQGRRFAGLEWRIYPAKKLDIEKAKETADKNVIFSKGFLDESDQNVLMGFAFGGVLPQVDPSVIQKAAEITENARKMQAIICEHYRSQYEERLSAKTQVVNKIDNQENVNPIQQKPESLKPVIQVQAKSQEKVVAVQVQPQVKPQVQPQVQPRVQTQVKPQVQLQPQIPQIQVQVQQSKEIIEIKPQQQQTDVTRLSKNQKKKLKKQQKQNQKMQQQLIQQQFNGGGQETNPVSNNLSDEEDFGVADFGADADDIFETSVPPRGNSQINSQNTSMNKGIPNNHMGRGGGFAGGKMMGNVSPFARNMMINGQNGMQGGGYQPKF